ncbi:MAG: fumarylacetoacetase [Acidobacteriota bacterium]
MTHALNKTHDPALRSWVASANEPGSDFPIQNLPFGVFRPSDGSRAARVGVAIGDQILDVAACHELGLLSGQAAEAAAACDQPSLNALMALGAASWSALRAALSELLSEGSSQREKASQALVAMDEAAMQMPAEVGDYTDFYCSIYHATNVGSMFRPDNPLMPNYKHLPIGYHGRSSSVVLSGASVRRPKGQTMADGAAAPVYGTSKLLDYELEVGFFVGPGNDVGEVSTVDEAEARLFGFCLVNDWSARDIQKWEYQPLGPFLAKSFLTSISPWVVTTEALAPYRLPAFERAAEDPQPLPHLDSAANRAQGGVDMQLEVYLRTPQMRQQGLEPQRLTSGNFRDMYWTAAQMLAHHCSNGCNMQPGDLLASGTVSGQAKDSRGCLLELTWRGSEPVELPGGEVRRFLQDGDEVILRGYCAKEGAARIGFGECHGLVEPAESAP